MRKLRFVTQVLAVPVLVLAAACAARPKPETPPGPPADGRYYRYDQGFSIMLPRDWVIREGLDGALAVVFAPRPAPSGFRANLQLIAEPLPPGYGFEGYVGAAAQAMRATYRDWRAVESGRLATESGESLFWQHIAYTLHGVRLAGLVFYASRAGRVHSLGFACEAAAFPAERAGYEAAARSFRFETPRTNR